MLDTVCSVGSLGSAPTLVESKEIGMRWKSMDLDSPPLSPTRESGGFSIATLSPITPLPPCRLRGIEDDEHNDDDDDDERIYRYPKL
jgi:hypothetical protein